MGILSGTTLCSSAASGPINALIQMQTRQYCPSTQCNQRMLTLYILNGGTCFFTQRKKNAFSALGVVCWDEREQETVRPIYASVCPSVWLRPRPESILSACWITLHSDTLAFVHSSNCEDRKEASNEDLAKHTKIGVLGLFGQTHIALPRYRSIHQTNVNTSEAQLRSVPTHIFSLLYWKMMAPHFPSVLLKEHIRSFLVSVILGTIRSIWIVEVFVLKK